MSYADRIRQGEHHRKKSRNGSRFSARELRQMARQAEALTTLEQTGWLPEKGERSEQGRLLSDDRLV